MFPNEYFYPFLLPLPLNHTLDTRPPTVYSLLESIVNYGKDEKQKIKDLAKYGRSTFFDFDYPLSDNINKEDFECMILNHFLMRRIGFDTFRAFNIQLNVKINSIMPKYNKMFDMLNGWDIFADGEITEREGYDNRVVENEQNTENSLNNHSTNATENISDRRNSELPQNQLSDLRDGNYVTNYNYDTNNTNSEDNSETTGNSQTNSNTNDRNDYKETIKKTQGDKLTLYKEFQDNIGSIYEMIFKDLECLFYQLY